MPAKATLSRVVHRKPEPFMPFAQLPEYLLCFVTETLECGHELTIFPQCDPLIAHYRRCHACEPNVISIAGMKKPVRAVGIAELEKKRA